MEESRTPTNKSNFMFNRTPTLKERRWNTLKVNTTNVRCSTPIYGDFRSPNLSPIETMKGKKSPASPMRFKKPMMNQPQRSPRWELKPPAFLLPKSQEETTAERDPKSSSSTDDTCSDDSNVETSLVVESRRRSVMSSNHSYVVNHAANVEELLVHMGMENYVDKFEQADINLVNLASLERSDLINIGLRTDDDCNRILDVINAM
ncbi:uncharacterized protein Dana_GF28054 [Drosophila ananassae]|uniref:SAM domain-containing protein n=1 Tax=Drosophila ananassae TaxID=7217 RepID=A0A0P8ZU90_DROAN|nr:protein matrimony [Drosophila ananassae]KPU78097.1 uncharacterized protein Dana_GF28054 [Drosophila ananassae]